VQDDGHCLRLGFAVQGSDADSLVVAVKVSVAV
jgi:hypothetical protein